MKRIILGFMVLLFVGCSGPLIYMGPDSECIDKEYQPERIVGTLVDAEDFIIVVREHDSSLIRCYYVPESTFRSTDIGDEVNFPDSMLSDNNNYNL